MANQQERVQQELPSAVVVNGPMYPLSIYCYCDVNDDVFQHVRWNLVRVFLKRSRSWWPLR